MKLGMYRRKERVRPNNKPAETLGELMLQYRLNNRMTQSDVAQLMGTTQARISEYETGFRTPSKRTINKFMGLFSAWSWSGEFYELYQKEYNKAEYNKKNKLDSIR